MKLLCLPCAGASAVMYYRWKALLPQSIDLIPLELAGRGQRTAEAHIESYTEQLQDIISYHQHHFNGDYIIFGHSMGGLLAYGLADVLSNANNPHTQLPKAIVVSACAVYDHQDVHKPSVDYQSVDDQYLINMLQQQNGTPPEVFQHQELAQMLLSNFRKDMMVCSSFYKNNNSLAIPIHVFAGLTDSISKDLIENWHAQTTADCSIDWFDGDHFYIQANQCEKPFLSSLQHRITQHI